jgi:ERCC4-type nuclease
MVQLSQKPMSNKKGLTVLVDSREKMPFDLVDGDKVIASETVCLATGDYTIKDIDPLWLCVERKSGVQELYNCFTNQRDRFFRQVERMKSFKYQFLVVECDAGDVCDLGNYFWFKSEDPRRQWQMRNTASQIIRSTILSLMLSHGIHVIFVGKDRERSKRWLITILERAIVDWHKNGRKP